MDPEPPAAEARSQVLQERRLARALGADQRAASAESGEARQQLLPGGSREPVAHREDAVDGEGVIPRSHGRWYAQRDSNPCCPRYPALAWSLAKALASHEGHSAIA